MAKPIAVLYIPREYYKSFEREDITNTLMKELNGGFGKPLEGSLYYNQYWIEYYWLVFFKDQIIEPELQVFNVQGQKPIDIEELKQHIETHLNKNKTD